MPEDLKDLQRGLIGAEPLMVIGNAVAGAGREVQDAWDLVQSHLTGGRMPSMPSFSVPSFSMPASTQASAPAPVSRFSSQPDPSDPAWQAIAAKHGGQPEVNVTIKSKPGEPDPSDIEWQQIAKQFGGAPEDPTGGAGQPVHTIRHWMRSKASPAQWHQFRRGCLISVWHWDKHCRYRRR
jgi:hypothetical protein